MGVALDFVFWHAFKCGHVAWVMCPQLEEVKRKAEEDDFVAAKQKMLNAEKARIQ